MKPGSLRSGEFVSARARICTGKKHSFGRVDISETAYLGLIEQKLFQTSLTRSKRMAKIVVRELVAQGFRRKLFDLFGVVEFAGLDDLHQTEVALVLKRKAIAILEIKNCVREFRIDSIPIEQKEFSAHAQMRYQRSTVVEIEKNMLAAAMNEIHRRVFELIRKTLW